MKKRSSPSAALATPKHIEAMHKAIYYQLRPQEDMTRPKGEVQEALAKQLPIMKENNPLVSMAEAGILHLLAVRHQRLMRYKQRCKVDPAFAKATADFVPDENMVAYKIIRRLLTKDIKQYLLDTDLDLPRNQLIKNPYAFTDITEAEMKPLEEAMMKAMADASCAEKITVDMGDNDPFTYQVNMLKEIAQSNNIGDPRMLKGIEYIETALRRLQEEHMIGKVNEEDMGKKKSVYFQIADRGYIDKNYRFIPQELTSSTTHFVNSLKLTQGSSSGIVP